MIHDLWSVFTLNMLRVRWYQCELLPNTCLVTIKGVFHFSPSKVAVCCRDRNAIKKNNNNSLHTITGKTTLGSHACVSVAAFLCLWPSALEREKKNNNNPKLHFLHVITYQKSFYEVLYKAFDIGETCLIAC